MQENFVKVAGWWVMKTPKFYYSLRELRETYAYEILKKIIKGLDFEIRILNNVIFNSRGIILFELTGFQEPVLWPDIEVIPFHLQFYGHVAPWFIYFY